MDLQPLLALSRISCSGRCRRRIQRKIHVQPDDIAWRFLRHPPLPYTKNLPQFFSAPHALAILRHKIGSRWSRLMTRPEQYILPESGQMPLSGTAIASTVFEGLSRMPKSLPPRLLYDAQGSALFEQITCLPEYYPTRTEAG